VLEHVLDRAGEEQLRLAAASVVVRRKTHESMKIGAYLSSSASISAFRASCGLGVDGNEGRKAVWPVLFAAEACNMASAAITRRDIRSSWR